MLKKQFTTMRLIKTKLNFTNSLNIILLTFCVLFLTNANAQGKIVDRIIAVVGNKIILKSDVEIQQQQFKAQGSNVDQCTILEELLLSKMLFAQAEVDSITVAPEEVESELNNRLAYFVGLFEGDESKMEAYYGKSLIEIKDDFRENIKEQLLSRRMQQTVIGDVKVTPSEVRNFFNEIPSDSLPFYDTEMEISQIVIKPKVNTEEKLKTKKELQQLRQRILEGENFATLALVYSDDPGSAQNGGELGFMSRGQLVNEFASAGFNLKNDEISNVVETEYGFHIIQMIEKRGETANMRHILIKPEIANNDLETALTSLKNVKKQIDKGEITFNEAVNKFSEDDRSKNQAGAITNPVTGTNKFETSQLDASLVRVLDTMKVKQVSKPASFREPDGTIGFRLLYLKSKTEPHKANLGDDYERIKQIAQNFEQQKALKKWISQTTPNTYIHIEDEYKHCNKTQNWVQ